MATSELGLSVVVGLLWFTIFALILSASSPQHSAPNSNPSASASVAEVINK